MHDSTAGVRLNRIVRAGAAPRTVRNARRPAARHRPRYHEPVTRTLLALSALLVAACQTAAVPGTTCTRDAECSGSLVCRAGRCRTACASQRDCPVPQLCLSTTAGAACGLSDDPECDGSAGSCADGLSCIDHRCVNACHAIADCPAGSTCATLGGLARCVRDDADAGPTDDAATDCHGPHCDPVVEVIADTECACARTQGGALWCWGNGRCISNGTDLPICASSSDGCSSRPVPVLLDRLGMHDPIADVSAFAMGNGTDCAITGGAVWCWGAGFGPNLGTGEPDGSYARAVLLEGGGTLPSDFTAITVGEVAAFATRPSQVFAWGNDDHGERGAGPVLGTTLAMVAPAIPADADVQLGAAHACALAGGRVSCWGANGDGQVDGPIVGMDAVLDMPTLVAELPSTDPASELLVGRDHACALTQGGDVWCWGNRNVLGVRADPAGCRAGVSRLACPPTPVARASMSYRHLGSGSYTNAVCAIDETGTAWCWGEDDFDRLPDSSSGEPVRIDGLPPLAEIAVADRFVCAIDRDHDVWCWGHNEEGELGLGFDDTTIHQPARVIWP